MLVLFLRRFRIRPGIRSGQANAIGTFMGRAVVGTALRTGAVPPVAAG